MFFFSKTVHEHAKTVHYKSLEESWGADTHTESSLMGPFDTSSMCHKTFNKSVRVSHSLSVASCRCQISCPRLNQCQNLIWAHEENHPAYLRLGGNKPVPLLRNTSEAWVADSDSVTCSDGLLFNSLFTEWKVRRRCGWKLCTFCRLCHLGTGLLSSQLFHAHIQTQSRECKVFNPDTLRANSGKLLSHVSLQPERSICVWEHFIIPSLSRLV